MSLTASFAALAVMILRLLFKKLPNHSLVQSNHMAFLFPMVKDMEMSCDDSVMKNTSQDIRANYSSSLLSISAKQSGLLGPLAFGEGNVNSRIKNVLNYKRPSFWIVILAIIILVFVLISFGTDSNNKEEQPEINVSGSTNNAVLADNEIIYKNNTLGFSLIFPKEWKDKYAIEESKDYISIFNKKNL